MSAYLARVAIGLGIFAAAYLYVVLLLLTAFPVPQ